MKIISTLIITSCFVSFFLSCLESNDNVSLTIKNLTTHKVKVPFDSLVCINNKFEIDNPEKYSDAKFKIVCFIDSLSCAPCTIKGLAIWNELLYISKNLSYAVIIESPSYRLTDMYEGYQESSFDHPVYIDTCHTFIRHNSFLPTNRLYHTLLLDKNDSVLIVGNPLKNEKIKELYIKVLTSEESL